ncbi:MAG: hypothetical protein M0R66_06705 [Candidatus Omnitrophica bacterium]|nr:hypothetical protein [Candidatus Omnitrophota bacterium]
MFFEIIEHGIDFLEAAQAPALTVARCVQRACIVRCAADMIALEIRYERAEVLLENIELAIIDIAHVEAYIGRAVRDADDAAREILRPFLPHRADREIGVVIGIRDAGGR